MRKRCQNAGRCVDLGILPGISFLASVTMALSALQILGHVAWRLRRRLRFLPSISHGLVCPMSTLEIALSCRARNAS
jgi:hypothetical protein